MYTKQNKLILLNVYVKMRGNESVCTSLLK